MSAAIRKHVIIYTDGACDPNPGVGGWAAVLMLEGKPETRRDFSGAERESTNNRMELTAVIEALRQLKEPCRVTLFTDSEYVKNAFTERWLEGWIKRGWKTSSRQTVKNQDLWQTLLELTGQHQIEWKWIRGHHLDPINNEVDRMAVDARLKAKGERR
jgi:ribonuclease HI